MRICLCIVSDSSYSHSHTLLITCTCCVDLTKGAQDKDFSYSFSILSLTGGLTKHQNNLTKHQNNLTKHQNNLTAPFVQCAPWLTGVEHNLCSSALWLTGGLQVLITQQQSARGVTRSARYAVSQHPDSPSFGQQDQNHQQCVLLLYSSRPCCVCRPWPCVLTVAVCLYCAVLAQTVFGLTVLCVLTVVVWVLTVTVLVLAVLSSRQFDCDCAIL